MRQYGKTSMMASLMGARVPISVCTWTAPMLKRRPSRRESSVRREWQQRAGADTGPQRIDDRGPQRRSSRTRAQPRRPMSSNARGGSGRACRFRGPCLSCFLGEPEATADTEGAVYGNLDFDRFFSSLPEPTRLRRRPWRLPPSLRRRSSCLLL
jgi:hypothetical protein